MKRLVAIAALGACVATGVLLVHLRDLQGTTIVGPPYVHLYDWPANSLEKALDLGDGQAFAAVARDPTLAHPDVFRRPGDAAYRFGRPLFGELTWLATAGDGARVPLAMAVLCVVAAAFAAAAVATLFASRGAKPILAVLVPLLPGAIAATRGLTPELLALAFAGWAVVMWERAQRATAVVVALGTAAVLTRETMVIVPLALALCDARSGRARRSVLIAGVPVAALAGWYTFVFARVGSWPFASSPPGTFGAPFAGLVHQVPGWRNPVDVVAALVCVVLAVPALRTRGRDPLALVVLGSVLLAIVMGPQVWRRWDDFGRPLLPLCAFGLVLLAGLPGRARDRAPRRAT